MDRSTRSPVSDGGSSFVDRIKGAIRRREENISGFEVESEVDGATIPDLHGPGGRGRDVTVDTGRRQVTRCSGRSSESRWRLGDGDVDELIDALTSMTGIDHDAMIILLVFVLVVALIVVGFIVVALVLVFRPNPVDKAERGKQPERRRK